MIGIDLGSRFVKIALKTAGDLKFLLYDTVDFYRNYVEKHDNGLSFHIDKLGISPNEKIIATGYGRNLMTFANAEIISEIKAHFKGALYQTNKRDFTLIDIGGQDSKVIKVTDGYIEDFLMNDKCAASSGRFIETASNILKMKIEELSACVLNPVRLNATCSVFSESEIVGKIAEGYKISEIAAGVNDSVARRFMPMLKKYSNMDIYASGGVASLYGVKFFLEKLVDKEIIPLPNTQFNGSIGCVYSS